MVTHNFTVSQNSYFNMKVLTFAKDENVRFFQHHANLSYDQRCWHFSGHTNFIPTCGNKQDLLISYGSRLLIQHSHAELLNTSVRSALSYWLIALQHILCIHSTFDGNKASLQHRPTSQTTWRSVLSSNETQILDTQ